jgi:hypothetical protein
MLEDVARQRLNELRSYGHELVRAIDQLLDRPQEPLGRNLPKKLPLDRGREKRGYHSRQN